MKIIQRFSRRKWRDLKGKSFTVSTLPGLPGIISGMLAFHAFPDLVLSKPGVSKFPKQGNDPTRGVECKLE